MSLAQQLLKAPPPGVHAGRGPGAWCSAGPGPASRLSELRSAAGDRCCVTLFPWRCFPPGGGTGAFPAARAGKGCAWSEKWGDHSEPPERSADVLGSPVPLGQSGLAGPCHQALGGAEEPFPYSRLPPRASPPSRCDSAAANPQTRSTTREARPRPGPRNPAIAIMNLHVGSVMSL